MSEFSTFTNLDSVHRAKRWRQKIHIIICLCLMLCSLAPCASAAAGSIICSHDFYYVYVNDGTCMKKCLLLGCEYSSAGAHNWVEVSYEATETTSARTEKTCTQCKHTTVTQHGSPNWGKTESNATIAADNSLLHNFTMKLYRTVKHITIPLAIISFASCGYTFLSGIFFGSQGSQKAIEKARKQFIWTIIMIFFVVFLPSIFSFAESIFKPLAWKPA